MCGILCRESVHKRYLFPLSLYCSWWKIDKKQNKENYSKERECEGGY